MPALRMLRQSVDAIRQRAVALLARLQPAFGTSIPGESVIGGGSTPEQSIPTWVIAVDCTDVVAFERKLRAGDPPVIARIEDERLVLDLRTVFPEEEPDAACRRFRRFPGKCLPRC